MSLHVSRQLSLYQRAQKIIEQQTKKARSKKTKTNITIDDLTMVPLQCYKQVSYNLTITINLYQTKLFQFTQH